MANNSILAGKKIWYSVDVTDWFPKEITPVYDGVYRTKVSSMDREKIDYGYSFWEHGLWGPQSLLKDQAEPLSDSANIDFGLKEWRGIAFNPFDTYIQPDTLHGQVLRDLSKELGMSEQEIAKSSLALYQMVLNMKKRGSRIIFSDEKGKITKDWSERDIARSRLHKYLTENGGQVSEFNRIDV